MEEIGEEALFFSLSYVVGQAYAAARGQHLDFKSADSIAFAILDDLKRNNWRVFEGPASRQDAGRAFAAALESANTLTFSREIAQGSKARRWRKRPLTTGR